MVVATLLAGLATGACALTQHDAVNLETAELHIRDVVVLDCVEHDQRRALGDLVIARAPPQSREITLDRQAIAALVRRRAPLLGELDVTPGASIVLRFPATLSPEAQQQSCSMAARSIAAGAAFTASDLVASDCPSQDLRAPLFYARRDGLIRASRDIGDGEALGAISAPPDQVVEPGQSLILVSRAGPVVIEREVRAAQSARPGEALFVTDGEGLLFSAPFPSLAEETAR